MGEKVRIKDNGLVGEVAKISSKSVTVIVGNITSTMAPTRVERISSRLADALDIVTHFIDDAVMLGVGSVRIIHGKATGVLREEIQKYLRTIPGLSVSDEDVRTGGTGVTVVKL